MAKWKNWGHHQDAKKGEHNECPHCYYKEKRGGENMSSCLIGFSSEEKFCNDKPNHLSGRIKIGALFFKCPHCSKIFWYHADKNSLRILERFLKNNSGFFKIPDTVEEFKKKIVKKRNKRAD